MGDNIKRNTLLCSKCFEMTSVILVFSRRLKYIDTEASCSATISVSVIYNPGDNNDIRVLMDQYNIVLSELLEKHALKRYTSKCSHKLSVVHK